MATTSISDSGPVTFGGLLRHWRALRHVSQLDLALAAEVSSRHISFLETGRAKPSVEMIARLSDALALPLRERNSLLLAAGFAPRHAERSLASPELSRAREAAELILAYHDPYPAFVMTRHWDVVMRNQSSDRVFGWLLRGRTRIPNVMRQVFHEDGLRPLIVNWDEVATDMLQHLRGQLAQTPGDGVLANLLTEVASSADLASHPATLNDPPAPLLTASYRRDGRELRFFSILSTFGAPYDVTLEELRIESMFPGDAATAAFCRELAAGSQVP